MKLFGVPPFKRTSISRNLTVSLVGLVLVVVTLVLFVFYTKQTSLLRQEVQTKADQYVGWLSEILAVPMWEFDDEQIEKIVLGFAQNELVQKIVVTDTKGTLLFASPTAQYGGANTTHRSRTITYQDQNIGQVDLTVSLAPLESELTRLRNFTFATLAGSLAVILIATGLLLRIFMRTPLKLLEQGMEKITKGDFAYDASRIHHSELVGIAKRFGEMADEVQTREDSLQAINTTLQKEIEERKAAEDLIRKSEAESRALVDAMPDLLFKLDRDGTHLDFKGPLQELYTSPEVFLGRTIPEVMPESVAGRIMHHLDQALTTGETQVYEYALPYSDGEHVFEGRIVAIGNGTAINIVRNITAQKHLEEQLRQAQKMEAVGKLAGGIAHDFNNLLHALSGRIQLMLKGSSRSIEDAKNLLELDQIVSRATSLIAHLLTFSRRKKPEIKLVDFNPLLLDTLKFLERTIPRNISLHPHLTKDLPPFQADPTQLEQILLNLIDNAVDALPDGGEITISTRERRLQDDEALSLSLEPGRYMELIVSDNGMGMDEHTRERIFEPFFTTKPQGKGTGLGLSTVYGIVKNHHGSITCLTQGKTGTTFTILLPIRDSDVVPAEPATRLKPERHHLEGNETLLVVDDEQNIREIARDLLAMHGYSVLLAASGEEALEILSQNEVQLVVLDLGMPGMGGERCLQEIRNKYPETAVIVASGHASNDLVHSPEKYGAKAFVSKPYRLDDMLLTIRRVLGDSDDN